MGWIRTMFLGDIGNRLDISDNENRIRAQASAHRRAQARLRERIAELEVENDKLDQCLTALLQILVERKVISEQELAERMEQVVAASNASSEP